MTRNDEVREALKEGQPLFFPGGDKAFRKAFIQRWYSDIRRRVKRKVRQSPGIYNGQEGSFAWTDEIK